VTILSLLHTLIPIFQAKRLMRMKDMLKVYTFGG